MTENVVTNGIGDIWHRYAEAVASLVEIIQHTPLELDEVTGAEGLRHLTRLLHMGVFSVHDYADTDDPRVFLAKTPAMLSGGVASDCIYHEAFLDPDRTYRLRGTRGTAELLEITAYQGRLGLADRADAVDSVLEDGLAVDDDGTFVVTLGPGPRPAGGSGNHLQTVHPDRGRATWLLIRQYSPRIDAVEPARFALDPVGGARPRAPLTLEAVDAVLADSVAFARRMASHFTRRATNLVSGLENRFIVVDESQGGGGALPSGHRFAAAGFRLRPDEAWVVTIPGIAAPPYDRAPYWGLQLCNFWYEPLDFGAHWAHCNNASAVADADGSVTVVVSEHRPPAPLDRNWLELRGHTVGGAQFRLSRTEAAMPEIVTAVVPLEQLA